MFLSVPFSNGNVELIDWGSHPDHSFDWSAFRTEWASFPNGKHDDQLDAVEMALRQCNFVGSGLTMSADPYNENDGR
jgi:phage terminase large subunit-like protein